MRDDIREAFEQAAKPERESIIDTPISERRVRQAGIVFMKQVEKLIENMPDQSMSLLELYEEIAGEAWHG